jgi:hypothetical protein
MALDDVADRLYALPPEEFTAARDAAAKADPALRKEVAALRRPTVSAWLVNVLAREDRPTLEGLLELGPALAEAQRTGAGAELRALGEQRRALLAAVVDRAVELSGRDVSSAVRLEVESTLEAGLSDPGSALAVRSGRLVRALSFAGFGGVDLEGATGTPVLPAPTTTAKARRTEPGRQVRDLEAERLERVEALEQAALNAAGELDDRVRELEQAKADAARAQQVLEAAEQAVLDAEVALVAAKEERASRRGHVERAAKTSGKAERAVARAQAEAERARAALDKERRS